MKKYTSLVTVLICMLMVCAVMFVACNKPQIKPHDVEIVLINPHTGEPMARKEYIAEPPAGTPIEVKIKDLVTGEYLTDDDLPETTLEYSITIGIMCYFDWDDLNPGKYQNYRNLWPNYERVAPYYHVFEISVGFDCRPLNPENPREFQRKYISRVYYFKFEYIR